MPGEVVNHLQPTSQGGWALLSLHVRCGARLVDSDGILVSRVQLTPSAWKLLDLRFCFPGAACCPAAQGSLRNPRRPRGRDRIPDAWSSAGHSAPRPFPKAVVASGNPELRGAEFSDSGRVRVSQDSETSWSLRYRSVWAAVWGVSRNRSVSL